MENYEEGALLQIIFFQIKVSEFLHRKSHYCGALFKYKQQMLLWCVEGDMMVKR
jgi:hypothetical protein